MRLLAPLFAALVLLLPAGAARAQTPVLVELFTSQGCSSCPPADALLADLAAQDGVIALALHVDYWDYLGWKDSFGSEAHTDRQRAYAKAAHSRSIYTPEIIVQGQRRLKGHKAEKIAAEIARCQAAAPVADLALERDGDALVVRVAAAGAPVEAADVHLVRFIPEATIAIEAGENAGREVTYTNIVTDWETIGRWDGSGPLELRYEELGDGPVAVIVQGRHLGPVLTAAELR
jgi:hypothetical protein